jgi:IS30 family transposase
MDSIGSRRLSPGLLAEIWRRWSSGQSLTEIGEALGKGAPSVYGVVSREGGIAPKPRCRSARTLSLAEREEISRGLAANLSVRALARALGRAPSTVLREIERHGGRLQYRATDADAAAWERAKRPKPARLARNRALNRAVARKLRLNWSPRQVSAWLKGRYPREPSMQVSHETIYRSLFVQARGALKKELVSHLRHGQVLRRPRGVSRHSGRGQIPDAVSIRERPAEAQDRAVPGHWEGDLIMGGKSTQVATLVERRTRFVMLVKIERKDSEAVAKALSRKIRKLPSELRRSLTWDRGTEMAAHKDFTIATDVAVYFCDPRSPWQRGSNENTNGLLRQYLPKRADLSVFSQSNLNAIAAQLNGRPRETLGWMSPAEAFQACVAAID